MARGVGMVSSRDHLETFDGVCDSQVPCPPAPSRRFTARVPNAQGLWDVWVTDAPPPPHTAIQVPSRPQEGFAAQRFGRGSVLESDTNGEIGDAFDTADDPISFSKLPFPERLNRTAFGGFATLHVIERDLPSSENDKPADGIASFGHTCR